MVSSKITRKALTSGGTDKKKLAATASKASRSLVKPAVKTGASMVAEGAKEVVSGALKATGNLTKKVGQADKSIAKSSSLGKKATKLKKAIRKKTPSAGNAPSLTSGKSSFAKKAY